MKQCPNCNFDLTEINVDMIYQYLEECWIESDLRRITCVCCGADITDIVTDARHEEWNIFDPTEESEDDE